MTAASGFSAGRRLRERLRSLFAVSFAVSPAVSRSSSTSASGLSSSSFNPRLATSSPKASIVNPALVRSRFRRQPLLLPYFPTSRCARSGYAAAISALSNLDPMLAT